MYSITINRLSLWLMICVTFVFPFVLPFQHLDCKGLELISGKFFNHVYHYLYICHESCECCFSSCFTLWSWVVFDCTVMWNVFIQLRMHQSLNDLQRVIQDSAHFLLMSDKSHHTSPDPVLPPLKFVCALNPTE